MISKGFIVVDAGVPKRDGYISPGADRKDSAGEFSNLISGEAVWLVQESMIAGECVGEGLKEDLLWKCLFRLVFTTAVSR